MKKMSRWLFPALLLSSLVPLRAQTTYTQISKEVASDRLTTDQLGYSVSCYGDYAVAGAPYHDHGGASNCGAVYLYQRDVSGNWTQVQELLASDRQADDHFGWSVSMYSNYIIVGAPDEDHDAAGTPGSMLNNSGSVYIFEKNGSGVYVQTYKLVAPDRADGDQMGWSVGIFASTAVVGAPYQEESGGNNEGAIYVFNRNGGGVWSLVNKALATDRQANDNLGYSVSVYNSEVAAGAPNQDYDASGAGTSVADGGAAYTFTRVSGIWTQNQKIVPASREAGSKFGFSVYRYQVSLLVGAPYYDKTAAGLSTTNAGAAFLYTKSGTWALAQHITASDRISQDNFGYSVAMSSHDLLVGAPYDDQTTPTSKVDYGSIYVFNAEPGTTWTQTQKMVRTGSLELDVAGDNFGYAVGIYDTRIVAGAINEDENASGASSLTSAGSIYVFEGCEYPGTYFPGGTSVLSCIGEDYMFNEFTGDFTDSYLWHVNTGSGYRAIDPVGIAEDSVYSGAASPFLTIGGVHSCMSGYNYRCKITSSCGASIYRYYTLQVETSSFTQKDEPQAFDRALSDLFGQDVAISGDYAIVGAPYEDHDVSGSGTFLSASGSAYIYLKDGSGNWNQVQKITADTRLAGANFGASVDIYGDFAVVGAPSETVSSFGAAGAIYLYQKDGSGVWNFVQRIANPVPATSDQFGYNVAIDGNKQVIAGAIGQDENAGGSSTLTNAGAAYIYEYLTTSWNTTPFTINASDRAAGDNLGFRVDIDGGYAVISAPYDDVTFPTATDAGGIYIFQKGTGNTWSQVQKFNGDKMNGENFGYAVSMYGTDVVVGARGNSWYDDGTSVNNVTAAGAVFVFNNSPFWQLEQKIQSPDGTVNGEFGFDASVSGDYLVASANIGGLFGTSQVYIFERCATISPNYNLLSSVSESSIGFGRSLDISGAYFITGAPYKDSNTGSSYVYSSCGQTALKSLPNGTNTDAGTEAASTTLNAQPGMLVYPNPATDELNISVERMPEGNMNIAIIDLNGRTISTMNFVGENNKIDVNELTPGVYFIQLNYEGGQMTQKFIKR